MTDLVISVPVADLCRSPDGARDRQVLMGAQVRVIAQQGDWLQVMAGPDDYPGFLRADAAAPRPAPTHSVGTCATHVYRDEDFKSPDLLSLPFGAALRVVDERAKFFETDLGFVPKKHLRPLDRPFADPVTVAQLHFGVPYLWGGNSTRGIDCSGLVAAALRACGLPCPGDSGPQRAALGQDVPEGAAFERGDLVFWQGHVGMMVDADTLIHANAHHMAVAYEPIAAAISRIAVQGDGPVLARKRL